VLPGAVLKAHVEVTDVTLDGTTITIWRTGCEGRISSLKRGYGWDRTRLDTLEGARFWTGQRIFTHNLIKIGLLAG
jgi:hypothetical protein